MRILFFQYFQLLSLLLAVICSRGLNRWGIWLFIPLLVVINCTEILGVNFRYLNWRNNYFLYNISYLHLNTLLMLGLFYWMLVMDKRMRQIFGVITVLLMLFMLLNISFLQGFWAFNTHSLIAVEIIKIILSCIVLFQLVFLGETNRNLLREPYFWINAGTLFYSLGTLVLFGLQQYILKNNIKIENKTLYHALTPTLNIILYTAWGYGFILCQKTRKPL